MLSHLLLSLLAVQASPVLPDNPNGPPMSLLVMPLHAEAGLAASAHALDEMILTAVTRYHRYQVLGPEDINALLGVEKMKDAVGCTDVSCAAEIGGTLGAPYLLAGSMTKLGDDVSLSVRLLDTRSAKVLSRGSAHGGTGADELTAIMAQAIGEVFGIPVEVSRGLRKGTVTPATQPSAPGAPNVARQRPQDVHNFQAMMAQLRQRMNNKEYEQMLADLDVYDAQNIVGPKGTDAREILTYYRAHACYLLQRADCLRDNVQHYLALWPNGTYKAALSNYARNLDQTLQHTDAKKKELAEKLAETEKLRANHSITDTQAEEINASLYAAFGDPALAAKMYSALMEHITDDDKWFDLADHCAKAHVANHAFADARRVLETAKARNAKIFAQRGMERALERLPTE